MAKGYTGTALHGDTVELISLPPKKEIRSQKKDKRKQRFEVRRIIKRGTREFLGYIKKTLAGPWFRQKIQDYLFHLKFWEI